MGHSLAPLTSVSKNTILSKNEIVCGEMLIGKWAIVGDYKATQVAKPLLNCIPNVNIYNCKNASARLVIAEVAC
jgi:hypothetical protein